jgi:hypothetical protein
MVCARMRGPLHRPRSCPCLFHASCIVLSNYVGSTRTRRRSSAACDLRDTPPLPTGTAGTGGRGDGSGGGSRGRTLPLGASAVSVMLRLRLCIFHFSFFLLFFPFFFCFPFVGLSERLLDFRFVHRVRRIECKVDV